MALDEELQLAIQEAVDASEEQIVWAGTMTTVSPLTVTFDGSGLAVPSKAFSDVVLSEGTRCVILKVGSDYVVTGTFALPDAEATEFTIGNGSATSFVLNHGLNTQDVFVQCFNVVSPYSERHPEIQRTSTQTITVIFENAPATNSVRIVVRV